MMGRSSTEELVQKYAEMLARRAWSTVVDSPVSPRQLEQASRITAGYWATHWMTAGVRLPPRPVAARNATATTKWRSQLTWELEPIDFPSIATEPSVNMQTWGRWVWWPRGKPDRAAVWLASRPARGEYPAEYWHLLRSLFRPDTNSVISTRRRQATWLTGRNMSATPFVQYLADCWQVDWLAVEFCAGKKAWQQWFDLWFASEDQAWPAGCEQAAYSPEACQAPEARQAVCRTIAVSPRLPLVWPNQADDRTERLGFGASVQPKSSGLLTSWLTSAGRSQKNGGQSARGQVDAWLAQRCSEVYIGFVRQGGAIEELIQRLLLALDDDVVSRTPRPVTSAALARGVHRKLWLADSPQLVPASLVEQAKSAAFSVGWLRPARHLKLSAPRNGGLGERQRVARGDSSRREVDASDRANANATYRKLSKLLRRPLLAHWTRRCDRWAPEETEQEVCRALLWQTESADRSALGMLLRILRQGRIRGSRRLVSGDRPIVSLTAVPLRDFPERRIFRRHLHRWDFEFFGVAIDLRYLESCGARPVTYTTTTAAKTPDAETRQWQQPRFSPGPQGRTIDWSEEREWRWLGDLKLDGIPSSRWLVFVPDFTAAKSIASITRQPIVLLGRIGR